MKLADKFNDLNTRFELWFDEKFGGSSLTLSIDERLAMYDDLRRLVVSEREYYDSLNLLYSLAEKRRRTKSNKRKLMVLDHALGLMKEKEVGIGESIGKFLPGIERNLITATEEGSNIQMGLEYAENIAELNQGIGEDIKKSILPPIVAYLMLLITMGIFGVLVFPEFAKSIPLEDWDVFQQIIYSFSTNVVYWGPGSFIIVTLFSAAFLYFKDKWMGKWRERADAFLSVFKIYRSIVGSTVLISLSAYLRSGHPIDVAIKKLQRDNAENAYIKSSLDKVLQNLREHNDLGEILSVPLFNEDTLDAMTVSVNSSPDAFPLSLAEIGLKEIKKARKEMAKVTNKLKFYITAFVGMSVAAVYITMITISTSI